MDYFGFLKTMGIPGNLAAATILFIIIFKLIRPINLLSSSIFEQKLLTKDMVILLLSIKYLGQTLWWVLINLSILYIFDVPSWTGDPDLSPMIGSIFFAIGAPTFFLIYAINSEFPSKLNRLRVRILLVILFMICLFCYYFPLNGTVVTNVFVENPIGKLAIIMGCTTVLCLPIPALMKQISKFLYWTKEKYILVSDIDLANEQNNLESDLNKKSWYVLHAINKELILLGNNPKPKLCTETKIIKLEDLCNIKMSIEEIDQDSTNDESANEESTNDSTTNNNSII
ncbi:hypothetical protein QNH25_08535 [Bacillus safensis]|uniref:hypothetical protein n=1 Tax=Bacillus TaxID=1386 RepID=UPI0004D514E3|nr:hypothetical protein [Bacillus safensis]TFV11335.1 hypothetical protein E4T85_04305 [Bacillus stratosphericus]KEP29394.1 hypothetical protein ER50_12770 [Bacillus safensis]MBG9825540.1 hypothetical protein [Bacillus safensis]MBG9835185.1 hypothetical protein [Bacillus safensis]MBG9861930.1 hypothetical protein [Bacillus safensis]